jgi:hypothetical protein
MHLCVSACICNSHIYNIGPDTYKMGSNRYAYKNPADEQACVASMTPCTTLEGPTSSIAFRRISNWKAESLHFPKQSTTLRNTGSAEDVIIIMSMTSH